MVAADVDADGRDEVLLFGPKDLTSGMSLWQARMLQDGSAWTNFGQLSLLATSSRLFSRYPAPSAVDIDRDGFLDLVFATGASESDRAIWVSFNDGKGGFSLDSAVQVVAGNESVRNYASSNSSELANARLFVLTDIGVTQLDWQSDRQVRMKKLDGLSGGRSIAAGDITGDGIEDLVIGDESIVSVYAGKPVVR
jgi:hypothetical protein